MKEMLLLKFVLSNFKFGFWSSGTVFKSQIIKLYIRQAFLDTVRNCQGCMKDGHFLDCHDRATISSS